jgi:transposase
MIRGKHEAATVAATDVDAMPRIEIVGDRRRVHDAAFRAEVVAESVAVGARVHDVAQRHGICPSLVYRWRRAAMADTGDGSTMRLFPIRIAASPDVPQPVSPPSSSPSSSPSSIAAPRPTGLIEIELADGVRVCVEEGVSLAALRRVISVLRER